MSGSKEKTVKPTPFGRTKAFRKRKRDEGIAAVQFKIRDFLLLLATNIELLQVTPEEVADAIGKMVAWDTVRAREKFAKDVDRSADAVELLSAGVVILLERRVKHEGERGAAISQAMNDPKKNEAVVAALVDCWHRAINGAAQAGLYKVREREVSRIRTPTTHQQHEWARNHLRLEGFEVKSVVSGPNEEEWEVSW